MIEFSLSVGLTFVPAQIRRKRHGCESPKEVDQEGLEEEGLQEEKGFKEEEKVESSTLTDRSRPHRHALSESPLLRAFAFLCVLLHSASACTPAATRGAIAATASLREGIDRILADPALEHSGTAILVVSLDRGDTLYAREIDRFYTPASNVKLFTAASALHYLGPGFRFRTPLLATGPVDADTLRGDLVLVGRGDPDLVTSDLAALADTLLLSGVRVVDGDMRADASYFDDVEWGSGWMWDDGPFWYWPYVSALTLNDNAVTIHARPGDTPGDPVRVRLDPSTAYMELNVTAVTGTAGADTTLEIARHWTPKANIIDVTGVLPADGDSVVEIRTVEDPALYAATLLAEILESRGVTVLGTIRRGPLEGAPADTIARHVSDSLAASVRNFLKISDNLTGEQLVKVIGAETAGPPGSYETGLAAERGFLAREAGIDTLSIHLADGSGVSRYNLVTARQIVRLLAYMANREDLAAVYGASLPTAGVDGTLEDRMKRTPAEGSVRAKTGSLSGVSALSGYIPTAAGERLAFSILMEFFVGATAPRRSVQDSLMVELSKFRR